MVLLPGLDGTGELFKAIRSILSTQLTVHIIPLPAVRDVNGPIRGKCRYEDVAPLVESAIARITGEEPFYLLVESFSGGLVPLLLQSRNLQIQRIIMIASFLTTPKAMLVSIARYLPMHTMLNLPILNSLIARLCLGRHCDGIQHRELLEILAAIPPAIIQQRLNAISNMQLPAQTYQHKLLYVQGEQDILVGRAHWNDIKTIFPNARLAKVKGPHFLCQSQAKACADLAMNFVST